MSQAKVDKYKQDKANRQQSIKKAKLIHKIEMAVGVLVVLGLGAWIGYSVVDKAANRELETIYFDVSALDDYVNELTADDDAE